MYQSTDQAKRSGCKVATVTIKDADAECSFFDEPPIRFLANTVGLKRAYTPVIVIFYC